MSASNKIIQAAAGNAAGEALYVEDVFSTYLYDGTSATQTITNSVDLDGEGGLVWIKPRTSANNHKLVDTERGNTKEIESNTTSAESTRTNGITSFNSNGFTLGTSPSYNDATPATDYVSWTFRKAPKFFDVVTYTGTGSARTVSHNLGSTPGCIIVKSSSNISNWLVYHRGTGATKELYLHLTNAAYDDNVGWNDTEPTDSVFTVGTSVSTNSPGRTYVAYLFAHNDGDGEFGEDADQDIIKCGSYTGGAGGITSVDLGFEPQWVLRKKTSGTDDWLLLDVMRGFASSDGDPALFPNTSGAESVPGFSRGKPTATGFVDESGSTGASYIYIAIRRGPMKTPESGTEVFAVDGLAGATAPSPWFTSGFVTDMSLVRQTASTSTNLLGSRLTGTAYLQTDSTASEATQSNQNWDYMDGVYDANTNTSYLAWMFRRAPGFFDVVAYEGDGTAGRTVSHNLGAVPELMIVKQRTGSNGWRVYVGSLGNTKVMYLDATTSAQIGSEWNDTSPTDSVFSVTSGASVNGTSHDYIAYLFATVPGVSKVGSYTGTDADQTIDCGFSNGARFILIKRTDASGDWYVLDSERGLTTGSDPWLELNTTDAESTGNMINVRASGFGVSSGAGTNGNSTINILNAEYIFLAIA